MMILAAAAALIAAFWLVLALVAAATLSARSLPADRTSAPATAPRVAVLVPARDEAAMLPLDPAPAPRASSTPTTRCC